MGLVTGHIYHIATRSDWEQAVRDGSYTISTRGRTLEQQGFIHCSDAGQVAGVANVVYRGMSDLVLLVVDVGLVRATVQYDDVPGAPAPFPHIYGPLNVDAVVGVQPFAPGSDGVFRFDVG
jgi:uncharacterized protein (DUF952 family)